LHSFGVWSVLVYRSVEDPRGACHWGADLAPHTCIRSVRLDRDHDAVMRIGGKAPGGGPILSVGISARFEYGFPPPRIVNSAVALKASASAENGAEWYARSGKLLSGRWT
jgi:hypothetical protein